MLLSDYTFIMVYCMFQSLLSGTSLTWSWYLSSCGKMGHNHLIMTTFMYNIEQGFKFSCLWIHGPHFVMNIKFVSYFKHHLILQLLLGVTVW